MKEISLIVLALVVCQKATPMEMRPLWTTEARMVMEGPATALDLDGQGGMSLVTAAYERVIAFAGSGEERWRFPGRGRFQTAVAVWHRQGMEALLYAGDNTGQFTCLDGTGKTVWQRDLGPVFAASPVLGDLLGNGVTLVLQGDKRGVVHAVDAATGESAWERGLEGECATPTLVDLNEDGQLEVAISTGAGLVYALSAAGEILWQFDLGARTPDWATSSPVSFEAQRGGMRVVCGSGDRNLYCLDASGKLLWKVELESAVASTISVSDFDADGRADIFAVSQLGVLYRVDEAGAVRWRIDTQGRSLASGIVADIDGDGALEYLLCSQTGTLMAFAQSGVLAGHWQFPHRTINMRPAVADFLADRPGLEIAVTGGESGRIICMGIDTPNGEAAEDGIVMRAEGLEEGALRATSLLRFHVENASPGAQPLMAQAWCELPGGGRWGALAHVVGESGVLELPVQLGWEGTYSFGWRVQQSDGRVLQEDGKQVALLPFKNDQDFAREASQALRSLAAERNDPVPAGSVREALMQEGEAIAAEAEALSQAQATWAEAEDAQRTETLLRTAALNTRAARGNRLVDLARPSQLRFNTGQVAAEASRTLPRRGRLQSTAAAPLLLPHTGQPVLSLHTVDIDQAQVLLFEGNTWENREVDQEMPVSVQTPLELERRCVPGEHEPVSLKLFNPTLLPQRVSCHLISEDPDLSVAVLMPSGIPTNQGVTAWDAMLPLPEEGVEIPPLATREIWLDIAVGKAASGRKTLTVAFQREGREAARSHVTIDVLPFGMAHEGAMRLCTWAQHKHPSVTQDMLAHGNNVFVSNFPKAPKAEGEAIDYSELDAFLAPLAGHDVYLLLHGIPDFGVPMEEEGYVPLLRDFLGKVFAHLEAQGIPQERVASYPYDEPGINGWPIVEKYVAFARQALRAWPTLQFYVNGSGDLPMLEQLAEVTGLWCPGYYMLSEDTPEMALIRNTGKTLWSYDCFYRYARPIGPNTKSINIVAQYRLPAVAAMHFGATGIGFWSYNIGPAMWEAEEIEYPLVYTNEDGSVTPSRRWKAVRESMEDARILMALKERLKDESLPTEARTAIEHLLNHTVAHAAESALQHAHLGVARYVLDGAHNDASVRALREEMLACIASL